MTTRRLELNGDVDFQYRVGDIEFQGRPLECKSTNYDARYLVNVFTGNKKIGKFTFFTQEGEVIFLGIFIEPEYREKGMSTRFIQEIFQIAYASGREFIIAVPQRKPLVCGILTKFGFEPIIDGTRNKVNRVLVGHLRDGSNAPALFFFDKHFAHTFSKATPIISQGYKIVETPDEITMPKEVVLGVPYLKVN